MSNYPEHIIRMNLPCIYLGGLSPAQMEAVIAYQAILSNPDFWNQSLWREPGRYDTRCGAKLCFFGHIAAREGFFPFPADDYSYNHLLLAEEDDPSEYVVNAFRYMKDGSRIIIPGVSILNRVKRILGISNLAASELSAAGNDLETIRSLVIEYLRVDPETGEQIKKAADKETENAQ
jgi:hypothetical protein